MDRFRLPPSRLKLRRTQSLLHKKLSSSGLTGRSSTPRSFNSIISVILGRTVEPGDDERGCGAFVLNDLKPNSNFKQLLKTVIASEAKQSSLLAKKKNGLLRRCAPRNDVETELRIPAALIARVVTNHASRKAEGVGNAGCPLHQQPRVRNLSEAHERSLHGRRDHPAFPHAMVLTAYFVLSPVSEFVLSPS